MKNNFCKNTFYEDVEMLRHSAQLSIFLKVHSSVPINCKIISDIVEFHLWPNAKLAPVCWTISRVMEHCTLDKSG